MKNVGPKLVPFLKAVCVYFVAWLPEEERPTIFAAILKVLPILCLCCFVCLQGVSLEKEHDFSRRILMGLVFSLIGDICLVWKRYYFMHGLASFAIAHILYIRAFGFKPLNFRTGAVCFLLTTVAYLIYLPGLEGPFHIAVPIYVIIISSMVWRAITLVQVQIAEKGLCRWTKMCACGGAILFALSDTLIGIDKFCVAVPYARGLIMSLYYAAQLGIALSSFSVDNEYNLRMKSCEKEE